MKKAIALALSLAMVMGLASCGGSSSTSSGNSTTSSTTATDTSSASSGAATTTPANKQTVTLATGSTTGTYYAVGSAMATTLNPLLSYTDLNITSTGASKANVQGITDGEYDLAILQSDVLTYAHNGENLFDAPETAALWVAGLYNETVQITAAGGITDVSQLKGKTVCVGDAGSGTEFNANQVLEAYGMTQDDINVVHASFGEAAEMLKQGQLDAAFTVAGAPTTAITELATSGMDFSMVSLTQDAVDYLTANYPFLVQENLPAGTYSGVDTETVCVAVQAVLVASEDMSEDAVYELVKTMFDNLDALGTAHAKFTLVSVEDAIKGASVPMHPGAEKYYKEIGAI
jgi:TRAP transporter TAXI family solute receptor